MNNLYRELAPITELAWAEIELEASRTFKRHIAGRRVVDVSDPGGPVTAAVSTGHLLDVKPPTKGVVANLRDSTPLVQLRVPFTLRRSDIDDVERGSQDSDWDPVKDAAKRLAFVEDRAIFEGYEAAGIQGIRKASSNPPLTLPGAILPLSAPRSRAEVRLLRPELHGDRRRAERRRAAGSVLPRADARARSTGSRRACSRSDKWRRRASRVAPARERCFSVSTSAASAQTSTSLATIATVGSVRDLELDAQL